MTVAVFHWNTAWHIVGKGLGPCVEAPTLKPPRPRASVASARCPLRPTRLPSMSGAESRLDWTSTVGGWRASLRVPHPRGQCLTSRHYRGLRTSSTLADPFILRFCSPFPFLWAIPPTAITQPVHTVPTTCLRPWQKVSVRLCSISPLYLLRFHPLVLIRAGIIIAASVVVAVSIALYESPQVRQWVDQSRRKIAIALHSLGDEIQPRRSSECSEEYEARKQEFIRRRELITKAREEGIAVDLDELAKVGQDDVEMTQRKERRRTNPSQKSFDDLVGRDGKLKPDDTTVQKATGAHVPSGSVRKRGIAGFAAGSAAASANPFADDQVLFDQDEEEAPPPKPFIYSETRQSSATVQAELPTYQAGELIHLDSSAAIADATSVEADDGNATQSFYSFASSNSIAGSAQLERATEDEGSDAESVFAGTLTPRSDRSALTGVSLLGSVGSRAESIAVLSQYHDTDHDARSETFSEAGFTDAAFSEAGFSEVSSEARVGMMTPSSWTDVGSDDESEWGGPGQGGQLTQ